MPAGPADAHEKGVAAGLADDAQDAAAKLDGVLEHDQRHRGLLEHDVVVVDLLLHEGLEDFPVRQLLVCWVLGLRIREVDACEDHVGVVADNLLHPHLQAPFHATVDGQLELLAVFHVDKTVVEDAGAFVEPEPQDLLLLLVELRLRKVDALEDLRDVPQVEEVVALRRRGQEVLRYLVVELDGGERQRLCQGLDVLHKVVELVGRERLEDALHLRLGRVDEANVVARALQAFGDDRTAATRRAHGTDEVQVKDIAERLLHILIPAAIVHPLPDQLQRRLRTVLVLSGHVEVVDEHEHALVPWRSKFVLDSLLNLALDDLLGLSRRGHRGHVDGQ
mmetsp:Transcript_14483/g.50914  ORF Transcript_14483/g.50914 Transcript_14483/m.50914 type:complete len:335 (+) Transcript_14483:5018-6022(+)